MSAPKLPDTAQRTSYDEAYLSHVATAVDRALAACEPRCACGAHAEPHHVGTPRCIRCTLRVTVARAALRRMRGQDLVVRASLGDADAEAELHVIEEQERERDERLAREPDEFAGADDGDIERDAQEGGAA